MKYLLSLIFWVMWLPTACAESTVIPFYDKAHGEEPWVTDLTPNGTHLLKDIEGGIYDSIGRLDNFDVVSLFGYKYFFANNALYRTDLTTKRTKVENGITGMSISHLLKHNNKLFFTVNNHPTIYFIHPRGQSISASTVLSYDQAKYKRDILSIKSGAYDNKMIVLVRNFLGQSKLSYDLRLSNGQRGWSQILNYKFAKGLPKNNDLDRIFVTDRYIFFSDSSDKIWRSKNTYKRPKSIILDQFHLPKGQTLAGSALSSAVLNDRHFLYFGTKQGNIFRTDGSQKRTQKINKISFPGRQIEKILSVFKNHLVIKGRVLIGKSYKETLYSINLSNGKWHKLAETMINDLL